MVPQMIVTMSTAVAATTIVLISSLSSICIFNLSSLRLVILHPVHRTLVVIHHPLALVVYDEFVDKFESCFLVRRYRTH